MTIFISVIGRNVNFVYTWLKEEARDLTKLWLIHSPKGKNEEDNFPKIAKTLVSNLKKSYPDLDVKLKVISDGFTIDPTMDAISEIILQEETNDEMLLREEFVINITGGTNANAAASMNSANYFETKVHYVLRLQDGEPKNKKLVHEIPILKKPSSDFSKFPGYFYEGGIFNGYFVIGENASTIDTLAAIDISNSMPGGIVDSTKWDSEIAYVSTQNLISIGNPCDNSVTAELLGNPTDCVQGFYPGEGKIISLQHKDTGNLALIVAGYSGTDTRLAGRVIAHRLEELKEMSGCEITVEGSTYNDAEINNKK